MKVEIQELPRYGRKMLFEIGAEKINEEKQHIVKEIQKTAEIPGFRKGKVPEQIIETRFNDTIKKRILEHLIADSYINAVNQYNLVPVIEPEVSDVKFDETISFSVYIEVKPEVVVKKYKGLVVKKMEPEPVTEQMIDEVLADWEKRKEFATVIIDPEKLSAWRKKIRQQLEQLSINRARIQEEEQLWKQLFENSSVEIPEKLMSHRARYLSRQQLNYIDTENKTQEEIEKIANEIFEKVKPQAEEQLKKYFILSRIAEIEKIEVSDDEVEQEIRRISLTSGENFEKVKKQLVESQKIDDIRDDLKIEKTFEFIKNNAKNITRIILPGEENHGNREEDQQF